ncbi:hypothetical protein DL769_005511 [Monosporascus sp. CRB-8-3]|nr:hypothetical protein DL769_005511 [Monosporascus sp. CRB-8-3]
MASAEAHPAVFVDHTVQTPAVEKVTTLDDNPLTARVVLVDIVLGCLVNASNLYLGLKTGFTFSASMFGAIFGYGIINIFSRVFGNVPILGGSFGPQEKSIIQPAATGTGGIAGIFVAGIPAMYQLKTIEMTPKDSYSSLTTITLLSRELELLFPTPTAVTLTIKSMHAGAAGAREALSKLKVLGLAFFAPLVQRVASYYASGYTSCAMHIESWGWWFEWTPSFIGSGILIGMNSALSMFGGAVIAWAIVGPILVATGHWLCLQGRLAQELRHIKGILVKRGKHSRYFSGKAANEIKGAENMVRDPARPEDQVQIWMWSSGLVLTIVGAVLLFHYRWGMTAGLTILACVLDFIFSFLAIQIGAVTDQTPLTAVAQAVTDPDVSIPLSSGILSIAMGVPCVGRVVFRHFYPVSERERCRDWLPNWGAIALSFVLLNLVFITASVFGALLAHGWRRWKPASFDFTVTPSPLASSPHPNTFTVIPNAPSAINANFDASTVSRPSRPPMTTKQAKKAYKEKNKGPKLSKAERRRQELFEQDRIRREFEKEKNQARARTARERRREKEEKERAEKKKKGLPLVEVHPSQDTLSRFLRFDAKKQTNNRPPAPQNEPQDGEDSDSGTLSAGDEPEEPPAKKQRTKTPTPQDVAFARCPLEAIKNTGQATSEIETNGVTDDSPGPPKPSEFDVDDVLADELLCEQLLNETLDTTSGGKKAPLSTESQEETLTPDGRIQSERSPVKMSGGLGPSHTPNKLPVQQPPAVKSKKRQDSPDRHPCSSDSGSPAATQTKEPMKQVLQSEAREPLRSIPAKKVHVRDNITPLRAPLRVKLATTPHMPIANSSKYVSKKPSTIIPAPRPNSRPGTPMGPPPRPTPRPPKFKSPVCVTSNTVNGPKFLSKDTHNSRLSVPSPGSERLSQDSSVPPSSTQLFVMSHLDDFFPSPSQEVRELYERPVGSLEKHDKTMSTTQDSGSMSSPSIREVQSKWPPVPSNGRCHFQEFDNKPGSKQKEQSFSCDSLPKASHDLPATEPQESTPALDIPFFSSQDFLLSQDWMQLADEATSPLEIQGSTGRIPVKTMRGKSKPASCLETGNDLPLSSPHYHSAVKAHEQRKDSQPKNDLHINDEPCGFGMADNSPNSTPVCPGGRYAASSPQGGQGPGKPGGDDGLDSELHNRGKFGSIHAQTWNNPKGASQDVASQASRSGTVSRLDAMGGQGESIDSTKPHKQPRPLPKPLFASRNQVLHRDIHRKFLMERSKTTVWEDSTARRKVQEDMDQFNKEEEEAAEKLLLEHMGEVENPVIDSLTPNSAATTEHTGTQSPAPPHTRSNSQTVNQLSCSAKRDAPMQRPKHDTRDRRPPSRPKSSYEEMLAMLDQAKSRKEEQQQPMPASQETDYGDVELEDGLCDLLS